MKRAWRLAKIFLNWSTSLGGRAGPKATRFFRYLIAGGTATVIDLTIFTSLIEFLGVHYILATIFAFLIASGFNYGINRCWGFKGTKRKILHGYLMMVSVATLGLGITVGLMALFVGIWGMHYFIARVIVVIIVFLWNYTFNSLITFRR